MIFKVLKNIYALKMSLSKIIYYFFKNSIYVFLTKIRVHVVSRFYCNFFFCSGIGQHLGTCFILFVIEEL